MFDLFDNPIELHTFLQLNFPALLYAKVPEDWNSEYYTSPYSDSESDMDLPLMEWIKGIKKALKPREDDIRLFFTSEFSFPEALLPLIPLSIGDVKTWLERAHNLPETALRRTLLKSVWPVYRPVIFHREEEGEPYRNLDKIADYLVAQPLLWSNYLRQAGLSAEDSWTILGLLEKPQVYLRAFAALLTSFQFVADAVIGSRETEAVEVIRQNLTYLEENQDKLLLINPKLKLVPFEGESKITVIPSIEPFALRNVLETNQVLIGFAIPSFLRSKENEEEEARLARSNFCQSLADPTRYKLCCLLAAGQKKQKELAENLGVSQATISHHLSQLRNCGVVSEDKAGGLAAESIRDYLQGVAEDLRIYG